MKEKKKVSALESSLITIILLLIPFLLIPEFQNARKRANQRACYANQKTIAGAIEMAGVDTLGFSPKQYEELMRKLVENGYLPSIPNDPGQGEGSHLNYRFDLDGCIYCSNHGFIQN